MSSVVDPTLYRPPLWSQETEYRAMDERKLIASAFTGNPEGAHGGYVSPLEAGGVVNPWDLMVTPRHDPNADPFPANTQSANLSVDVLPGTVAIAGTDHRDQGTYICNLTSRVNIPVGQFMPTANRWRRVYIFAQVVEGSGDAPAYWQLIAVPTPDAPVNSNTNILLPGNQWPKSALLLAITGLYVGGQTTRTGWPGWPNAAAPSGYGSAWIIDMRHYAKPAPVGSMLCYARDIRYMFPAPVGPLAELDTGFLDLFIPPSFQPFDMEYRVEFGFGMNGAAYGGLVVAANAWWETTNGPGGRTTANWKNETVGINSFGEAFSIYSYTWTAFGGHVMSHPTHLHVAPMMTRAANNFHVPGRVAFGRTILRLTPSGSGLVW